MNKKKLLMFGVPIFALALVAGALISYLGSVETTVNVEQGLYLDENNWDEAVEKVFSMTSFKSGTFVSAHNLDNQADIDADVNLIDGCSYEGTEEDDSCDEVDVSYYELTGYTDTQNTPTKEVNVEDLGDKIQWTVVYDGDSDTYKNGHAGMALIIGDNSDVSYQVHNNDGTDSNFADGTWLVSPYDTTLNSGCEWNGWHSSCENTEVETLDWITAVGERNKVDNPDYTFVVTIDKSRLSVESFTWVVYSAQDGEFTDEDFGWATADVNEMHIADVGTLIVNPLEVLSEDNVDFTILTEFPIGTSPGEYTIETTVNPVE